MSIGRTNAGGGGTGGTLTVTAPAGVTVTASKDGKTKTRAAGASGVVTFKGLGSGVWTVTITGDGEIARKIVTITTDYNTAISFNAIPEFDYTGEYEIVSDDDNEISVSQDNWKIRFLTSGTLIFTKLHGAVTRIDVFLVGGGSGSTYTSNSRAGGGAGGYTRTIRNVVVELGKPIEIIVGAGSAAATSRWTKVGDGPTDGGSSSFGEYQAAGGHGQTTHTDYKFGCSGGTGGQIYGQSTDTPATDGEDGSTSGKGQRSTPGPNGETGTTGEFGDETATLYSNGGCYGGEPRPNSGDAGRSKLSAGAGTDGAAGIVIIRNAREAA